LRYLKGIVLFLVLANVGYYLYVRGLAPPPPQPSPAPVSGTVKISADMPPRAAPASASRCVSIGPFGELADSSRAEGTLRGGGYAPRQRSADGEVQVGMFVYVPVPATAAAAAMLRKMLKGAGFGDAPEVTGPNSAPVISLGVFNDPKRGQTRLALAQQAGIDAQSIARRHVPTVYWLDVDLKPDDGAINPADLHADSARGPQLGVTECPGPSPGTASGATDVHTASMAQ
jgi:hypothetical protein